MIIEQEIQMPKLHNFFTVKVIDTNTNEVVQEAKAENVVLDQFYHYLFSNQVYGRTGINTMHYGSGSGTISPSRTSLFTQIGAKSLTDVASDTTPELVTFTGKIIISESEHIGEYLREVGLSWEMYRYAGNTLITHALLTDSEGNPISIGPKTGTQIIELYCTVYIQKSATMSPFPNALSTYLVSTNYASAYLHNPTVYPQGIGFPSGSYDSATKTYTTGVLRIAAASGNNYGVMLNISNRNITSEQIVFPNLTVFPKYTFLERQIGVGDGSQRCFSFTKGLIYPDSDVIKVGGVTKTRGVDYTIIQGSDLTPLHEPSVILPYGGLTPKVYSSDGSKQMLSLLATMPTEPFPQGYPSVVLDYQSLFRFNNIALSYVSTYGSYTGVVYGSTDGSTWTLIGEAAIGSRESGTTLDALNAEYRYLWVSSGGNYTGKAVTGVMAYGKYNIMFATAPANAEVITAKWDVDVPPKDGTLFYDLQIAYTATW